MRGFALFLCLIACSTVTSADVNVYARRVVISSAQSDAEVMARTGVLWHCGRNGGRREGVGCGPTPDAALRACCFYGRYRIVEKGVAYSPLRRQWFACIRYE
jgi:hypothetical protein